MVKFIEPDVVEQGQGFNEPDLLSFNTVNEDAADIIASQAAVINAPDLSTPDELESIYLQTIGEVKETGTDRIKDAVAAAQAGEYLSIFEQEAVQAVQSGEITSDSFSIGVQYNLQEADKLRETALERAFVDKVLTTLGSDPDKLQLIEAIGEAAEGTTIDTMISMTERGLALSRLYAEEDENLTEQSWVKDVFEFGSSMFTLAEYFTLLEVAPEDVGIDSGSDLAKAINKTFFEMSDEEFVEYFPKLKEAIRASSDVGFGTNEWLNLGLIQNITSPSFERSVGIDTGVFIDAVDTALMLKGFKEIASLAKAGKIPKDGPTIWFRSRKQDSKSQNLALLGQRKLAADVALDTLENPGKRSARTETNTKKASDHIVPSAIKDPDYMNNSDVANTSSATIRGNSLRLREILDALFKDERLRDDEKAQAVLDTFEELRSEYGASEATDVRINPNDVIRSERGVTKVQIVLGRQNGEGFETKEEALKAIEVRKLPIDAEVMQASDNMFYVKISRDINEKNIKLDYDKLTGNDAIFNYLRTPASMIEPDLFGAGQRGASLKGFYSKAIEPINKTITSLPKDKYERLSGVLIEGNYENPAMNRWYNRNEFEAVYKRLHPEHNPTQQEWEAYRAFITKNDIDHAMLNWSTYLDKKAQGYITGRVMFDDLRIGDVNVRKVDSVESTGNMMIFDTKDNKVIGGKSISVADLNKKLKEGYTLYQFDSNYKTKTGYHVNHVLAKNGDIRTGNLKFSQVPYRAGGHRSPYANFYVKQARTGTFEGGKKYVLNPLTHAGATTKEGLKDYVDRMNIAFDAYDAVRREVMTEARADKIIKEQAGIEGGFKYWDKQVKDGLIDATHRFEVVGKDSEPRPSFANDVEMAEAIRLDNVSTVTSMIEKQGIPFYRGRGTAPLRGPDGERAALIDPMRVLEQSMSNSLHKGSLANFKVESYNRWFNTFGEAFKNESGLSKYQTFMKKKVLTPEDFTYKHPNPDYVQRAINSHHAIRTMLMTHNRDSQLLQRMTNKIADLAEGTSVKGKDLGELVYDLEKADPISGLRSLAYDVHLGLWALDQIVAQGFTGVTVAAMDGPIKGARYLERASIFQALNRFTSDEALNYIAKRMYKGEELEDFKEFIRIGREMGMIDLKADMAVLDHNNTVKHGWRDKSRSIVMAVERFNKAVGYAKAWDEVRADTPVGKMNTKEALDRLSNRAELWSANMSQASAARWQKGYLSVPLQFMPYTARMIENFWLPKAIGGNPQIKAGERVRMALVSTAFFGLAGAGPVGVLLGSDMLKEFMMSQGVEMDDNAALLAFGGLVDVAFANTLGGTISDRVGIGSGVDQLISKLTGEDIGQSSAFDFMVGPIGSTIDNFRGSVIAPVSGILELGRSLYTEGEWNDTQFITGIRDFVSNINSANDMIKAYYIVEYGEYLTRSGRTVAEVDSEVSAIGALLGLTPVEATATYRGFNWVMGEKDNVNSLAKGLTPLVEQYNRVMREFHTAGDSSDELLQEGKDILREINIGISLLRRKNPDAADKVARKVGDFETFSDYTKDQIWERTERFRIGED